jgi:hypothetical protein
MTQTFSSDIKELAVVKLNHTIVIMPLTVLLNVYSTLLGVPLEIVMLKKGEAVVKMYNLSVFLSESRLLICWPYVAGSRNPVSHSTGPSRVAYTST